MESNSTNTMLDGASLTSIIFTLFVATTVVGYISVYIKHIQLEKRVSALTNGIPVKPFTNLVPFIGDISLLLDPVNYQEKNHPVYGKIFATYLLGEYYIVMQDPSLYDQVFFDNAKNIKFEWTESINQLFGKRGIQNAYGDDHKKQRRMILNYVGVPSLNRLFPGFVQIFNKHILSWVERTKNGTYIDIIPELSKAVWEAISFVVIGDDLPQESVDELRVIMDDFGRGVASLPINIPFTEFGRSVKAGKKFRNLLLQEYKRRQSMPDQGFNRKDFFQTLINETCNEGHPEGFNIDTAVVVIWASLDTTKGTSLQLINTMIDHAKEWERVREDIQKSFGDDGILAPDVTYSRLSEEAPYLSACVKEVMRLSGILLLSLRRTINDFEVNLDGKKYTIPSDSRIVTSYYYYNKDENSKVFSNPTSFIPERFLGVQSEERNPNHKGVNVAFGLGDRQCPGSPLARLEMEVIMVLMSKFKWIRREREKDWKMLPFPLPPNGFWIKAVPLNHQ